MFKFFASQFASKNDLHDLLASMNIKNSDLFGPDPFNLRNCIYPKNEIPATLEETIARYSKTTVKVVESRKHQDKNIVPLYVHIIWVGGAFSVKEYRERVLLWKKHTKKSGYQVILWTDQSDYTLPENSDMQAWCQKHELALLNIEEIFSGNCELDLHYRLELMRANWAGVSDILREIINEMFGGIYSDTDVWPAQDIPVFTIENTEGIALNIGAKYENLKAVSALNNDLLMSLPHATGTKKIIKDIKDIYVKEAKDVFEYIVDPMDVYFNYQRDYALISAGLFFKNRTMNLAGPSLIVNIFGSRQDMKINNSLFHWRNEGSWYDTHNFNKRVFQKSFKNKLDAFKYVFSCILNDLKFEPRVLRLSDYEEIFKQYNIADEIVKALTDYYPDSLKSIQFIRINNLNLKDYTFALFLNRQTFRNINVQALIGLETAIPVFTFLSSLENFKEIIISDEFISALFANYKKYPSEIKSFFRLLFNRLNENQIKSYLEIIFKRAKNGISRVNIFPLLINLIETYKKFIQVDLDDFIIDFLNGSTLSYTDEEHRYVEYWLTHSRPSNAIIIEFLIKLCSFSKGTDIELQGISLLIKSVHIDLNNLEDQKGILEITLRDIQVNKLKLVKFLIEQGANPKKLSANGQTLLHILCENVMLNYSVDICNFCHDLLNLLIQKGIDVNTLDSNGRSCLDELLLTVENLSLVEPTIKVLIENGASLNKIVPRKNETTYNLLINSNVSAELRALVENNHLRSTYKI